jgi:hypothetical protein
VSEILRVISSYGVLLSIQSEVPVLLPVTIEDVSRPLHRNMLMAIC